jgi:hypothetical protein
MDVGDFLELQGAFERNGESAAAAEEKEVLGVRVFLGQRFQGGVLREDPSKICYRST